MVAPCELVVVSGPNGSGKTTMARVFSAQLGYPYIGADEIAASLAPHDPASQRIAAGRRFSTDVLAAIERGQSVVIESTLSGRTFARTMRSARDAAFTVTLVHLFLDSPDTCVARVAARVRKGGHDVAEHEIRRRFTRSAANFWKLYRPLCDRWVLMYNAAIDAQPVAVGDSATHSVQDIELFASFIQIVESND